MSLVTLATTVLEFGSLTGIAVAFVVWLFAYTHNTAYNSGLENVFEELEITSKNVAGSLVSVVRRVCHVTERIVPVNAILRHFKIDIKHAIDIYLRVSDEIAAVLSKEVSPVAGAFARWGFWFIMVAFFWRVVRVLPRLLALIARFLKAILED